MACNRLCEAYAAAPLISVWKAQGLGCDERIGHFEHVRRPHLPRSKASLLASNPERQTS